MAGGWATTAGANAQSAIAGVKRKAMKLRWKVVMRCPREEQPQAGRKLGLARLMDEVSLINRASVSPRSPITTIMRWLPWREAKSKASPEAGRSACNPFMKGERA